MASLVAAALAVPRAARLPLASPARFRTPVPLPLKCRAGPSPPQADTEDEEKAVSRSGISTSTWCAGLGAAGFLETGYLTYSKLTNTDAFCPVGAAGSCGDILNSDYSYIFGLPLPLIGMVAYGLVALLALRDGGKNVLSGLEESYARLILLGTTTSMATASAYFLYILNTKFAGTFCSYCLISAILSFSLFFLTIKDFDLEEIRKGLGLQLAIAGIVVTALSNSYMMATPQLSGSSNIELDLFQTEITKESTPLAVSLAKHLHSIGAKMYGAFWCSHCNEQKEVCRKSFRLGQSLGGEPQADVEVRMGSARRLQARVSGLRQVLPLLQGPLRPHEVAPTEVMEARLKKKMMEEIKDERDIDDQSCTDPKAIGMDPKAVDMLFL